MDKRASAPRVVLCVAGGIAAYKAPELVREFIRNGYDVQVVTTAAALKFVSELSLSVVSRRDVRHRLFSAEEEGSIGHIHIANWADVVVVAPATANLMARSAAGMADDLVSTVLLATTAPIVWAPAMNTNMWFHAATQRNAKCLRGGGAEFVGPDAGELACGWEGEGKMSEPAAIVQCVTQLLRRRAAERSRDLVGDNLPDGSQWRGRKVLISAGPTRTYLDPVRFMSNASTGKMGFALAEEARRRGADVTLVAGPVSQASPEGVKRMDVETNQEMLTALEDALAGSEVDLMAMVAAVSDLRVAHPSDQKLPKETFLTTISDVQWEAEVDLVATLARRHRPRTRFLAFAAEIVKEERPESVRAQLIAAARDKLTRKGTDAIFVNRVGRSDTGIGSDANAGYLVFSSREGSTPLIVESGPPVAKRVLGGWLLDSLARQWR
ncbi:MAG: bifunctional phosphopantothenoylcysteine decarboxylase/phosphopantothenate--cysteine ligase CoaBC [Nannocystaceae bacterium]